MYRARTKQQELRRRLLTYTVAPVVITTGVILLVMYTIGYRYNPMDHRLEQGGLVQFITQPTGATVEVDGVKLPGRTNTRLDATAGTHTVVMNKPGYHPWQKTVTVEPGKLLWLNYTRFIPKEINVSSAVALETHNSSIAAYQQDRMVLLANNAKPELTVADLSDERVVTRSVAIDQAFVPQDQEVLIYTVDSLDKSGRYAIVKAVGTATRWLVVDTTDPDRSQDISTLVADGITKAMFYSRDARRVYVVTNDTLRQVNLDERSVSAPLVSNIQDVSMSRDGVIAYVGQRDPETSRRVVGYYTAGATEPYVLRRIYDTGEQIVRFRTGEYDNRRYGALQVGNNLEIFSFQSQSSDTGDENPTLKVTTIVLPEGSDFLSISPNGRFILSQKSSTFITYDLELMKVTTSTLKGDTAVARTVEWLDNSHVWSDRDGTLRLYEFDGENARMIDTIALGHSVLLSKNGKQLWYFDTIDQKMHIKRAQLVI